MPSEALLLVFSPGPARVLLDKPACLRSTVSRWMLCPLLNLERQLNEITCEFWSLRLTLMCAVTYAGEFDKPRHCLIPSARTVPVFGGEYHRKYLSYELCVGLVKQVAFMLRGVWRMQSPQFDPVHQLDWRGKS